MTKLLLLIGLLVQVPSAFAHGPSHDPFHLAASAKLHMRIAQLAPQILEPSLMESYVVIKGQKIALNGPMWELVRGWLRLYYRDLQDECDRCIPLTEEDFLREAESHKAETYVQQKLQEPLMEAIEHIAHGAADLGGELGPGALVADVSAEIGEQFLVKFIGGVHFLCKPIITIITLGWRRFALFSRTIAWSEAYGNSALTNSSWYYNPVRMLWARSIVRRTQQKLHFVTGPIQVNENDLRAIDLDGKRRYFGMVKDGKRAKFFRNLVQRSQSKGSTDTTLAQRSVRGSQLWRYALLTWQGGNSDYLFGKKAMDHHLDNSYVWAMEVEEGLAQKIAHPVPDISSEDIQKGALTMADRFSAPNDEIRQGLAEEFAAERTAAGQAEYTENLLRDIESVFNTKASPKMREFHANALEALVGFMFGIYGEQVNEKGEMYGVSLVGITKGSILRFKKSKMKACINQWGDNLRIASQQTDPKKAMRLKYESMEVFLRIQKFFNWTTAISEVNDQKQMAEFRDEASRRLDELNTFRPWAVKRTARSYLPILDPRPTCRQMEEVHE